MIHKTKDGKLTRLLCGLLALYLLNISIDPPDWYSNAVPEDLSINDQESILEVVIEKVMGYENAIVEYDDNDSNRETSLKKGASIDHFVLVSCHLKHSLVSSLDIGIANSFYLERIPAVYLETFSPPPQA